MDGVVLRVVNTGVATHAPHWHGNHVFIVQRNGVPEPAGMVEERDVVRMEPLYCVDVILPAHTGYDAFPPLNDPDHPVLHEEHPGIQIFPMHCHAEMSQTAAGGMYPLGMLTDWHLGEHREAVETRRPAAARRSPSARRAPPQRGRAARRRGPSVRWAAGPRKKTRPRSRAVKAKRRAQARRRPATAGLARSADMSADGLFNCNLRRQPGGGHEPPGRAATRRPTAWSAARPSGSACATSSQPPGGIQRGIGDIVPHRAQGVHERQARHVRRRADRPLGLRGRGRGSRTSRRRRSCSSGGDLLQCDL